MPLYTAFPQNFAPDSSKKDTITFVSPADGSLQQADIYSPSQKPEKPLPLVLAPHPITWKADEDYHVGVSGLTCGYHPGYYDLANQHGVVIAMPHGHHREIDLCSLGYPMQIEDMAYLIDGLEKFGYPIDKRRVYASGLSMGGQEGLLLAGPYPEKVTAIFAYNPIVDLAAWQEDLAKTEIEKFQEIDLAGMVAREVGGLPQEIPECYAERSATGYVEGLSKVPTLIFWTDQDLIVPRQATHHSYRLYQMVKQYNPLSPFAEYNHTTSHGETQFTQLVRWQMHEWCDYDLALRWLLLHEKASLS